MAFTQPGIDVLPSLKMVPSPSSLTDDIVEGGMIGAGEEVGEEVDHHEAVLLALK